MLAAPVRRLERAEVVWQRAQERYRSTEDSHLPVEALGLSRAAQNDGATLAHALVLGRATVRRHAGNEVAAGGVHLLERAIAFLDRVPRSKPGFSPRSGIVTVAVTPEIRTSASTLS